MSPIAGEEIYTLTDNINDFINNYLFSYHFPILLIPLLFFSFLLFPQRPCDRSHRPQHSPLSILPSLCSPYFLFLCNFQAYTQLYKKNVTTLTSKAGHQRHPAPPCHCNTTKHKSFSG